MRNQTIPQKHYPPKQDHVDGVSILREVFLSLDEELVHARYGDVHLGQTLVLFQEGVEIGIEVALEAAAETAVLKDGF